MLCLAMVRSADDLKIVHGVLFSMQYSPTASNAWFPLLMSVKDFNFLCTYDHVLDMINLTIMMFFSYLE